MLLSLTTVAAAQPGFISTVAGTGTFGFNGDGIPATTAQLAFPFGVFVDGAGNLFIADTGNSRVRRVEATGPDTDGDGVPDFQDNCPLDSNFDQEDLDGDGIGNVCDATVNVNGAVNVLVDDIIALNLNSETALVHHLENALASFASGNEGAAVNQLNAFILLVDAQRGHALTDAEADDSYRACPGYNRRH